MSWGATVLKASKFHFEKQHEEVTANFYWDLVTREMLP